MVQKVLTARDFNRILDSYAGRQLSHIPIVKSISNMTGQETLTEGTAVSIKAYFMRTGQNFDYGKQGFLEKGDAVVLSKYADGVTTNDIIEVEGNKFRIKESFHVPGTYDSTGSGTEFVYTACNLFLFE